MLFLVIRVLFIHQANGVITSDVYKLCRSGKCCDIDVISTYEFSMVRQMMWFRHDIHVRIYISFSRQENDAKLTSLSG